MFAAFASASALLPSNNEQRGDDNKNNENNENNNNELFDRLALYRFSLNEDDEGNNNSNSNSNSDSNKKDKDENDDASYVWWPALRFDSHHAALTRFAQNPAHLLSEHRRFVLNLLKENDEPAVLVPVLELLGLGRWVHHPQLHQHHHHHQDIQEFTVTGAAYLHLQNAKQHAAALTRAIQQVSEILSQSPPPKKTTAAAIHSRTCSTTTTTTTTTSGASANQRHEKDSSVEPQQQQDDNNHDNLNIDDDQDMQEQQQNNNNDELEDPGILPNDSWEAVWDKLQWTGWVQYHDHASRQDLYSMPPAADHWYDQTSFTLEQLQEFCQTKYHWQRPLPRRQQQQHAHDGRSVVSSSNTTLTTMASTITTPNRRTQPQDPSAPLLPSSSSSDESSAVSDPYDFGYLWSRRLQKDGWVCVRAWNLLHDWYYLKPGVNRSNAVFGQNAFRTPAEVIRYVQEQDGYQPSDLEEGEDYLSPTGPRRKRRRSVARRLSLDSIAMHTNKKKKKQSQSQQQQQEEERAVERNKSTARKQSKQQQRDKSSSSSSTRTRSNSKTNAVERSAAKKTIVRSAVRASSQNAVVTAQKKKSNKSIFKKQDWWKTEPIPTATDVLPILERLGVQCNDGGTYVLPFRDLPFESSRGLGIFFVQAGVPNLSKLTKTETAHLTQWARFVNVPAAAATPDVLKQLELPVSDDQVHDMLRDLYFEIAMGYIFLPNCPADRKQNVHFFAQSDWNTKLRRFLQTAWCLESPLADDKEQRQHEDPYNDGWTPEQQEAALTLRLWGALFDDKPLVELQELPKPSRRGGVDLAKLQRLPELPPVTLDFVEKQDEIDSQGPAIQENGASFVTNDNSLSLVTPVPQRNVKEDHRPWYVNDIPVFSDVWPILKNKMKWTQTSSGHFENRFVPDHCFTSLVEVRRFVATTAIPNIERGVFSDDEKRNLNRWAMTVNLDQYDFGREEVSNAKLLKESNIKIILFKLGFSTAQEMFYLINADRFRETRRAFRTLESLLVFILTHDSWSGDPEQPFTPQDYHNRITKMEMMQVIRFALEMAKPSLPTLRTPEKPKSKSRRCRSSLAEPPTSNVRQTISETEESSEGDIGSGNDDAPQHGQDELASKTGDKEKDLVQGQRTCGNSEEKVSDATAQQKVQSEAPASDNLARHTSDADNDEDTAQPDESPDSREGAVNESQTQDSTCCCKDVVADLGVLNEGDSPERTECEARLRTSGSGTEMQHEGNVRAGESNEQEAEEETETMMVEEHQQENVEHAACPLLTQAEETIGAAQEEEDSVYFSASKEETAENSHQKLYTDETSVALEDSLKETYQLIKDMDTTESVFQADYLTQDP